MTDAHCSYCDGHPINATGEETVDHFRPKALFCELAYAWTNLFLACSACNHAKGERWDELLLRPDDPGFRFERYFECDFATGELRPAPTASPEEQARARRTIEILRLNRADACKSRLRALRWLRHMPPDTTDDDLAYRVPDSDLPCRELRPADAAGIPADRRGRLDRDPVDRGPDLDQEIRSSPARRG